MCVSVSDSERLPIFIDLLVSKRLMDEVSVIFCRFLEQHPFVNDELPNRIQTGTVLIKPNVKHIYKNRVEFEDNSTAGVDIIIKATGYIFGFPFLDKEDVHVFRNRVDLYELMWPPNLSQNNTGTLAIIGCIQQSGGVLAFSEIQSRWATRVFKVSLEI